MMKATLANGLALAALLGIAGSAQANPAPLTQALTGGGTYTALNCVGAQNQLHQSLLHQATQHCSVSPHAGLAGATYQPLSCVQLRPVHLRPPHRFAVRGKLKYSCKNRIMPHPLPHPQPHPIPHRPLPHHPNSGYSLWR